MNLSEIAKKILSEDSWGNNPSAAGAMSPGKPPTQAPTGGNLYNAQNDFQKFETRLKKEEDAASSELKNSVGKNLKNKKVLARASKGSIGQYQDYEVNVSDIDIQLIGDEHHIVLAGTDKKDYFLDTGHQVKILGAAEQKSSSSPVNKNKQSPSVGGVVQPQTLGVGSNKVSGA